MARRTYLRRMVGTMHGCDWIRTGLRVRSVGDVGSASSATAPALRKNMIPLGTCDLSFLCYNS